MFKPFCSLLFALFFSACQPLQYNFLDGELDGDLYSDSSSLELSSRAFGETEPEEELFLSDKLDLIFVLDTSPQMQNFYSKNFLNSSFLRKFKDYDWRLAWTDASLDPEEITQTEKKEEEDKSCGFLSGLGLTAGGLLIPGGSPVMFGWGLSSLSSCMSSFKSSWEPPDSSFANGGFLPFEQSGKKLNIPFLDKSREGYDLILSDTFQKGNPKIGWQTKYDAPELKSHQAYPFMSMIFSLIKGSAAGPQKDSASFFRSDSSIVYVIITTADIQADLSVERIQQGFKNTFGSKSRLRIIPVTLTEDSSFICSLDAQGGSYSPRLRKAAALAGGSSLDICSSRLTEELFAEITKSLQPAGF